MYGTYIHVYTYIERKSQLTSLVWGSLWLAPINVQCIMGVMVHIGKNLNPQNGEDRPSTKIDPQWMPQVFLLPAGLLMLMRWRIYVALVQFGCYQHWHKWMYYKAPSILLDIRLSLELSWNFKNRCQECNCDAFLNHLLCLPSLHPPQFHVFLQPLSPTPQQ